MVDDCVIVQKSTGVVPPTVVVVNALTTKANNQHHIGGECLLWSLDQCYPAIQL